MADYLTPEKLEIASLNCDSWEKFFHGTEFEDVVTHLGKVFPTLPKVLKLFFDNGLFRPFSTETELLAYIPATNPSSAYAFDSKKFYLWNGTQWKDEGTSPLDMAKAYAEELSEGDREFTSAGLNVQQEALKEILKMGVYVKQGAKRIPIATDKVYKNLLSFNRETNKIEAVGIDEKTFIQAFSNTASIKAFLNKDATLIPFLSDRLGRHILAFDKAKGVLVGLFEGKTDAKQQFDINQILFYGQSLSRGGANEPGNISLTQPYHNLTFVGGTLPDPDSDTAFTSFKPLVEGYSESPCSGSANYATYLAYVENGINPLDRVYLASSAGVGGAHLRQLIKGTVPYNNMLKHIINGKSVSEIENKTHSVLFINWAQGEANLGLNIDLDVYRQMLPQHFVDMKSDIRAITGQSNEIHVISYQLSTRVGISDVVCKTQFELAKKGEIAISCPTYLFDYDIKDSVHFHPPSYKWLAAYYGRVMNQIMEGKSPLWLEPMGATIVGKKVTVNFKVPTGPLVFDTSLLAETTDMGFAVSDGTSLLPIENIVAHESTVTFDLVNQPSDISLLKVRYALDYLGVNKPIAEGRSGNLRDSTPDTVLVQGVVKPLYYICPHFELDIINGAI